MGRRIIINSYFPPDISKIICFTLLMLVITSVSSVYAENIQIENVIPAYSASCIVIRDIPKITEAIKASQTWQKLIEDAKQQLQNNSDIPKPLRFMAVDMWNVFALATDRVAIAHLDPTKLDSPTVIVDLGDSKGVFEGAQKILQLLRVGDKFDIVPNAGTYLDVPYGIAKPDARFAFIDNLFVFTPNEEMFKAVVDVYRDKAPSISLDPKFMTASNRIFSDGEAFVYINSEVLPSLTQALGSRNELKALGTSAVKAISWRINLLSHTKDQELYFYSGYSNKLMAQLMSTTGTLISPKIVPASSADVFFAVNAGDLASSMDTYFEQIRSTMSEEEYTKIQGTISGFEAQTGLNLRNDVLTSLTGEFGLAMSFGPENAGMSLQNGIMVFVGVKDRDKCKMLIERLLASQEVERTNYKDVEITSMTSTTGPEGPMGYAFTGDLLVFSSVKKITSIIDGEVPLITSERFAKISKRLPESYSALLYFDPSKTLTKLSAPLSQNENTMSEIQAFGSIGGAITFDGQGYKMKLTGDEGKSWLDTIGDLLSKSQQNSKEKQENPDGKMDE